MSSRHSSDHVVHEKHNPLTQHETVTDDHVVRVMHADGHLDLVDTHAIGGDIHGMPKGYYTSLNFIMTFIAICLGSISAYLGWVLPANTLSLINEDIGPSTSLNWVATMWTLGSSIGFLLFGRLSDIFGRKHMLIGAQVLSVIGCIVGATAQSINTLIGANLLNGLSAAAQLSFGIFLGELVSNKLRGVAVTAIFASSLPFAVFGPSIARAFILHTGAGWRWSYYLGIIISTLSGVLYQFFYHPPTFNQLHVGGKTRWGMFKEMDFGGIFLFISGTVLFLIGLSWGGQAHPWKSAAVISTLVIGGLLLVAFCIYEFIIFKGQGLMPPRLFSVPYTAVCLVAAIAAMVYYGLTILWPGVLGAVYARDTFQVGLASSVVGGGVLLGQIGGGIALSYLPKVKWQTIFFSLAATGLIGGLACLNPGNYNTFIALGILGTFSVGWIDNLVFAGVTLLIEPQDIGLATGVLGSLRALGGAIAQSIYVSILTNEVSSNLPKYVSPAVTSAGLPASSLPALFAGLTAGNLTAVPGITPAIATIAGAQTTRAYTDAFKIVFYTTIPFGVLLFVAACFVPDVEKYLTSNVARRLQGTHSEDAAVRNQDIEHANAHAHTGTHVQDHEKTAAV